jgi:hypothetical protein
MSKGSKPRPENTEKIESNWDKVFGKSNKRKVKLTQEDHKVSWDWAKDALLRQDKPQRKKR